jgi:hypothetical protein
MFLGSKGRQQSTEVKQKVCAPSQQKETGQSVQAPNVNSLPAHNIFRVVGIVQQIMTEFSGAVSEEENVLAIIKIVLNLMKQNGR